MQSSTAQAVYDTASSDAAGELRAELPPAPAPANPAASDTPKASTSKAGSRKANRVRGGQSNNDNSMRMGFKARQFPEECRYIAPDIHELRYSLETAWSVKTGKSAEDIPLAVHSLIATVMRSEKCACLAEHWLRCEKGLTAAQKMELADRVMRYSEARDAAIQRLGLGLPEAASGKGGGDRNRLSNFYDGPGVNGWGAPAAQNGHGDVPPGSDGTELIPGQCDAAESDSGGVA